MDIDLVNLVLCTLIRHNVFKRCLNNTGQSSELDHSKGKVSIGHALYQTNFISIKDSLGASVSTSETKDWHQLILR